MKSVDEKDETIRRQQLMIEIMLERIMILENPPKSQREVEFAISLELRRRF